MTSIIDQMVAHVRKITLAKPEALPEEYLRILQKAQLQYMHGEFAPASSTIVSIPTDYYHVSSIVILRVRVLLAQGYFHKAVRLLKEQIGKLDTKKESAGEDMMAGLDAGEKMQRDIWRLWVRLCEKDDEGEGEEAVQDTVELAYTAWKEYCEWTQMENYTELHSLLYEIVHQLGVGTCNMPLKEWVAATDALIAVHMDAQDFFSALSILRIRNKISDPTDPTFTNIMLEYFPMLSSHPEIKLIEARTRLILHDIYVAGNNHTAALQKLMEVDECLRVDADVAKRRRAVDGTESPGGLLKPDDISLRAWDLRWTVRYNRALAPRKFTGMSDEIKLAKLSSLAHEAAKRDIPDLRMKALASAATILLEQKRYQEFLDKETEWLHEGCKYGRAAVEWRAHIKGLFEHFPPPDDPEAEGFIAKFQKVMEGVDWNPGQGINNAGAYGVTGLGIGLLVWTGVAEMLVGIEELWRNRARDMVERLRDDEIDSGVPIETKQMSRSLRRLLEE